MLKWHAQSHLTQRLQGLIGRTVEENLNTHSIIVEQYYRSSVEKLFNAATTHNMPVTTNLPFAYEWNYGGHISRLGHHYSNTRDVTVHFKDAVNISNRYQLPLPKTQHRFDLRTAEELDLSTERSRMFFRIPHFLDVVHLTAIGHRSCRSILPVLKEVQYKLLKT